MDTHLLTLCEKDSNRRSPAEPLREVHAPWFRFIADGTVVTSAVMRHGERQILMRGKVGAFPTKSTTKGRFRKHQKR